MTSHHATSQMDIEQGLLIDIATRNVARLLAEDTLGKAARLMADKRISSVVIGDEQGRPVGIVTERNILQAMQSGRAQDCRLVEVMSSPVICAPSTISVLDAFQLCRERDIRHLVLVDGEGLLAGVASETDFRQHLNLTALAGFRKVITVAKRSALTLPPDAALPSALGMMLTQRKSCVIVLDGRKPVGIVTERDVVRYYSGNLASSNITLGDVMTRPVLTIPGSESTSQAAEIMLARKVRHLIVVDEAGEMTGLVSEHDLTQVMVNGLAEERSGIEESFLHTLIDTLPDLIWLKDEEGVYLACNHRFETFFGIKEPALIGKTDYDFVESAQADLFREYDRLAMSKNGPSINEEWLTFAEDGYHGLFETIKTPMRDARGKLIGVLGIARDITSRKRIEDALYFVSQKGWEGAGKFLDALARYLGETLSVDYVIIDKLTEDTEYAETVALYARGEIVPNLRYHLPGTPCENVMGGEFCYYPEQVQQRFPRDILLANMNAESYAGMPLWGTDGRAIGLIAVLDDKPMQEQNLVEQLLKVVASRTAAELERDAAHRALQQREQEFRTLAEHMPDNMVRYDTRGAVRYMNPAFLASVAQAIRPSSGLTTSEAHPDYPPALTFQQQLEQVVHSGHPTETELVLPAPDGEQRSHLIRLIPEHSQSGDIIGVLAIGQDITEQKLAREQLQKEKRFVDDVINSMPGVFYLLDSQGRFLKVNRHFLEVCGYTQAELDRMTALDLFEGDDRQLIATRIGEVFEHGSAQAEADFLTKSGQKIPYLFSGHLTHIDEANYLVGVGMDISERKQAEDNLRVNASVFETSLAAIVITDAANNIIDVNPAFTRITGYNLAEVQGKNPRLLSSGQHDQTFFKEMWHELLRRKNWRGEIWNRRKSGELYAELLSISAVCDSAGSIQHHVGVFTDISYLKEHEAELSRVANYDALTGAPNRRLLADRLHQAILQAQRNRRMLAVCYLDLDGFKRINDQYGHETGDQLLVTLTRRLQEELRAGDTLARLGGDEFVLLFSDLVREQECIQILERTLEVITQPTLIDKHEITVSASIGISFYPLNGEDGDTLLRHADQAMYIAKQTGKNRYHLYDSAHDQRVRSLHESRRRIAQGLEKHEFELYYQPKIELATGKLAGVEALIRWHHPELGLLLPAEFLPLIEDSELDIRLGEWVMDSTLTQLDDWRKAGLEIEASINIAPHHLQSPDFLDGLSRRLKLHPDLPHHCLQIEVLETAALEDIVQSAKTIQACRELGVSFALDDFGTGYSSLAYLRKLSAETLKIDQSFVRGMLHDAGDRAIVQGIIALARTFNHKIVAEGIEDKELIQVLSEAGCQYGQGYGIAYPMPAGELLKWWKNN